MAIGLVVFDGEKKIHSISLDASPSEMIEFSEEYYFAGHPALSAKQAWEQMIENFNLSVALMISNVMCRSIVLEGTAVSAQVKKLLMEAVEAEGRDNCELEQDEIDRLFTKNYTYLTRVFSNHGVAHVAHDFASRLKRDRRMTRLDIIEQLRALSML